MKLSLLFIFLFFNSYSFSSGFFIFAVVMSIAFERSSGDSIQNSGFIPHGMSPRFLGGGFSGDRRFPAVERRMEQEEDYDSSSSTSSIGQNSDEDSGEDCGESEVQSLFKGPLDTMEALEEVLPIKRGISKFYNGKSKSFTSLADASSASSIKDFAKTENPYNRKRKNLLARNTLLDDKNRNYPLKDNTSCLSKRPATFNPSVLAVGSTMDFTKRNNNEESRSIPSSSSSCLPPLHPHGKTTPGNGSCTPSLHRNSKWRSFSLSDLQCVAAATATSNS